ncbi:branched-chain amino acid transport system permease protein [Rhodoligotrophos appendicifer]|uniref:branched-chain amino acid ABC transporter permease n=1 Tax=Rhodoligotrophos appendicifer TaxID=987056 RepID=UPI001184D866|nr:branched-chain amino acid ABC transporter permease [Rhodoligotrophos appendicifer]
MTNFFLAYIPLAELIILSSGLAYSQYIVLRAGVFSLATAGFAAIGAYAAANVVQTLGLSPVLGGIFGTAMGALAGLMLSLPLSRLRGAFQAIATVAFIEIMVSLILYAEPITGGALGMNGIPKSIALPGLLVFLVLVYGMIQVVVSSGVGRAFDAIRQDETVAVSLGISVQRYQCLAFVLSGGIAGLTGALIAFNTYSLSPEQFGFPMLVAALSGVILGGRISVAGPLVGVMVLSILPELARPLADQRLVMQGVMIVLVIIFMPLGIVDTARTYWRSRQASDAKAILERRKIA